jgi:hypothetical protein
VTYDIAEILELRDPDQFLKVMQNEFEAKVGKKPFFRITGTPTNLGEISASLSDRELLQLLERPPGRDSGWTVRPLPPLRRNALGFENDRIDFQHMKFIRNGHIEFWTAIDHYFCWQQDEASFNHRPRLYPYPVVEYPVSFCRLYKQLITHLNIHSHITFQMQYINIKGVILLPYRPDSIGFMHPMDPIKPADRDRLVFPKQTVSPAFDPDVTALQLVEDLYYEFGYAREHIPFFDPGGHATEL